MRLLITGAGGMLGQDVVRAASAAGIEAIPRQRTELDITDRDAVQAAFRSANPDVVISCAAWTDVDGAESAVDSAFAVNADGAGNVARAAARTGAWTIHISSDYVFDGTKLEPYLESDPAGPVSAYGRSKLAGEDAVAREAPDAHTIVRSAWLFGAGGRCFPSTILRLADERDEIQVVDDQVGCPTFTGHLAAALVELAQGDPPVGPLHIAGDGKCSWYEFAQQIVAAAGASASVIPCRTADMPRPAIRPPYSVLRSERGAPQLADWRQGLEDYLAARVAS
jgi:dTDP-4-dehydrorhamnose reductase